MDDNGTGTNALQVTIQLSSGVPQSVQVKYVFFYAFFFCVVGWFVERFFYYYRYLSARSVSARGNITWAGQVKKNFLHLKKRYQINDFFF